MLRVICVRTGDKYNKWFEDNLKYMIDIYSGLKYNEYVVIDRDLYGDELAVANKLQMFDMFRDGQNIYFDLDVIIKGDCNHFLKRDLTVAHAFWRLPYHTPLNSSVISWQGDYSYIWNNWKDNEDEYLLRYNRGIDQYLYERCDVRTYHHEHDKYYSLKDTLHNREECSLVIFNQNHHQLIEQGWWNQFQLRTTR